MSTRRNALEAFRCFC